MRNTETQNCQNLKDATDTQNGITPATGLLSPATRRTLLGLLRFIALRELKVVLWIIQFQEPRRTGGFCGFPGIGSAAVKLPAVDVVERLQLTTAHGSTFPSTCQYAGN